MKNWIKALWSVLCWPISIVSAIIILGLLGIYFERPDLIPIIFFGILFLIGVSYACAIIFNIISEKKLDYDFEDHKKQHFIVELDKSAELTKDQKITICQSIYDKLDKIENGKCKFNECFDFSVDIPAKSFCNYQEICKYTIAVLDELNIIDSVLNEPLIKKMKQKIESKIDDLQSE